MQASVVVLAGTSVSRFLGGGKVHPETDLCTMYSGAMNCISSVHYVPKHILSEVVIEMCELKMKNWIFNVNLHHDLSFMSSQYEKIALSRCYCGD